MGKKARSGFTLLELLVSLVLLSISFLAIIPLLLNTMALNNKTDMGTIARDLATQKVEELMTQPYTLLSDASATGLMGTSKAIPAVATALGATPGEYVTAKGVVSANGSDPKAVYFRSWDVRYVPMPLPPAPAPAEPRPVTLTAVVRFAPKGNIKLMAETDPAIKSRSFSTLWSF